MPKRPTILIVGNYNREDYLHLFDSCKGDLTLYFAEFASPSEVKSLYYQQYGTSVFWGNYKSAHDMLSQLRPDKVVFFFIESYYHIVLNLVCKALSIPTYHLDHGIRDVNVNARLAHFFENRKGKHAVAKLFQKLSQLKYRVKARLYLNQTIRMLPPKYAEFAKEYIKIRNGNTYARTFKVITSPLRSADAYIAFSPKVYEALKLIDSLPEGKPKVFIGIPYFDHLATLVPQVEAEKAILFIDQGYAVEELLGWTKERYTTFISEFNEVAKKNGYIIYAKAHPRQITSDACYTPSGSNIILVSEDELPALLQRVKLTVGFYSTYLLPIISLSYNTVITLENHPVGKLNVSKSFIDAGVVQPVYSIEELHELLPNISKLHQQQLPNKAKFTEEWMYKFDGKSGERLREILLSDSIK